MAVNSEERVFKTPMTFSPHVSGKLVRPSPSRIELWKEELGLEDDCNLGGLLQSDDEADLESEHNNNTPFDHDGDSPSFPSTTFSFIEYQTLQRELEERNTQRDDLLFKIKMLTDKTKQYKCKLENKEVTKRQQIKILQKTQEVQLQDQHLLIKNLEDLLEEHETRIVQLEAQLDGKITDASEGSRDYTSVKSLVQQILDLQSSKSELTTELLHLKVLVEGNYHEEVAKLKSTVERLQEEKHQLQDELIKQWTQKNSSNTDNEKQLCKLEIENDHMTQKVKEMQDRLTGYQEQEAKATQQAWQDKITITKLKQQNEDMLRRLDSVESRLSAQNTQSSSAETCLREQVAVLRQDCQDLSVENRDLATRLATAEAKPADEAKLQQFQTENAMLLTKVNELTTVNQDLETRLKKEMQLLVNNEKQVAKLKETQMDNSMLLTKITELTGKCQDSEVKLNKEKERLVNSERQILQYKTEVTTLQSQMAEDVRILQEAKEEELEQIRSEHRATSCDNDDKLRAIQLQLVETKRILALLIEDYRKLRDICLDLPSQGQLTVKQVERKVCKAIHDINHLNNDLVRKYRKEMQLRKKYHNELVELRGNIRVFCRVRPKIKEDGSGDAIKTVVSFDVDDNAIINVLHKERKQVFEMDQVFDQNSTQEEVFSEIESLITSSIDGYNVCIFAYGQTGSGKTYTMEGSSQNPGINQRALQVLFRETADRSREWNFTISVSVVEIYNENIRDLLGDDPCNKLEVKMNPEGGLYVPGLVTFTVKCVEDVNQVFALGQENRATATTNMNEHSSRSHALLCVNITGFNTTTGAKTTGKLNLVDLAGSERVSKSGAEGTRLKEAQNINKSLATLGDVIHALRSKHSHVPYRNSKLTYLLQDCLGGDSKTLMIVQVAPVEKNAGETIASLNFAQRVRTIELGQATRKVDNMESSPSIEENGKTPMRLNSVVKGNIKSNNRK